MTIRSTAAVLAYLGWFALTGCQMAPGAASAAGTTRHYFVAAEPVQWDYAPTGKNRIKPMMGLGEWGKKTRYAKVRYVEYTDATFIQRKSQPPHLGILGPVFRAEVGDTLKIHFLNRGKQPYSIHPHGVFYDKDNEGAPYGGIPGKGHAIEPGSRFTYTWTVPERAGPGANDPSSVVWPYHSHVKSIPDMNAGLVGAMIITRAGMARADGSPKDVDRELFTLFQIFDENDAGEEDEGNLMHAINGYVFGNLPGLDMRVGERVRWYLIGLGNEVDLHTPHWHAATVLHAGQRKDVINLLPATAVVADMQPDVAGTWLYHCHVADHISAGMLALYHVRP